MTTSEFLQLPLGVKAIVVVMLWPAIWAAALMAVSLAGDLIRHSGRRTSPAWRTVA
jgi:hypothetical protein